MGSEYNLIEKKEAINFQNDLFNQ